MPKKKESTQFSITKSKVVIDGAFRLLMRKNGTVVLIDPKTSERRVGFRCDCTERALGRAGSCSMVVERELSWPYRITVSCASRGGCSGCLITQVS